jgi:hypothetical protein
LNDKIGWQGKDSVKEIEQYRDLFINREDAYATQRRDGSYICRRKEVTDQVLVDHLKGRITCGWYCLNKANEIKWACVDADSQDGQKLLQRVSQRLKGLEIPSYIEESREGRGHLWIFLDPLAAKPVRKVLERVVEEGMEVFPKQNRISPRGYGSLVRGPLGIHLRTGKRYGFLERGFHRRGGFDPDTDIVLNLCLTIVPEIDPHRTGPTELAGMYMEGTRQRHGLSTEKLR